MPVRLPRGWRRDRRPTRRRRAGGDRSSASARCAPPCTPGRAASAASAVSTSSGSTPSIKRRNTSRAAVRSTARIATVISRPTIGSASGNPSATPPARQQHRQRREAVGAGMQAVGNQCGRTDSAADADPVQRHQLVADEADEACGGDPAHVLDLHRVDQPHARPRIRRRRPTGRSSRRRRARPGPRRGRSRRCSAALPRACPARTRSTTAPPSTRRRSCEWCPPPTQPTRTATTMTACASAVTPSATRLILTARMPMALDSSASSTLSAASWLCGTRCATHRRAAFVSGRTSPRWWAGTPGPACSALNTASLTSWRTCSFSRL